MFIVNPTFSLVAIVVVLILHTYLVRKHLKAPFGDVRSGLMAVMAKWAAKKWNGTPARGKRRGRPTSWCRWRIPIRWRVSMACCGT